MLTFLAVFVLSACARNDCHDYVDAYRACLDAYGRPIPVDLTYDGKCTDPYGEATEYSYSHNTFFECAAEGYEDCADGESSLQEAEDLASGYCREGE